MKFIYLVLEVRFPHRLLQILPMFIGSQIAVRPLRVQLLQNIHDRPLALLVLARIKLTQLHRCSNCATTFLSRHLKFINGDALGGRQLKAASNLPLRKAA